MEITLDIYNNILFQKNWTLFLLAFEVRDVISRFLHQIWPATGSVLQGPRSDIKGKLSYLSIWGYMVRVCSQF